MSEIAKQLRERLQNVTDPACNADREIEVMAFDVLDAIVRLEQLEAENAKFRGLVETVLDADECNGRDVSKADRELRLPKAWMTEARKVVGNK